MKSFRISRTFSSIPLITLVLALLPHRVKKGRVVFEFDVKLAVNQREAPMDDLQLFAAGSTGMLRSSAAEFLQFSSRGGVV